MCFCNSDVAKLEKIIRTEMAAAVFFHYKNARKTAVPRLPPGSLPPQGLQKAAFRLAKDGKRRAERPCFAPRKATSCNTPRNMLTFNGLRGSDRLMQNNHNKTPEYRIKFVTSHVQAQAAHAAGATMKQ